MGKSFSLPDISSKFNFYQFKLSANIDTSPKDWMAIQYYMNAINTLLKEYAVPTSTELYNERTHINQTRKCGHCFEKKYKTVTDDEGNQSKEYYESPTEIPSSDLEYSEPYQDFVSQVLAGMQTKKRDLREWICPKCSESNLVADSPTSEKRFGSTSTHGVVPDMPVWTIEKRSWIDSDRMVWIDLFRREVDTAMMAYQQAFFDEHGHNMSEKPNTFGHDDK